MHRVLSFQMGMSPARGFGESSEFVTKRMCFSFIFFIGFLALLGGFLLGRITTERNAQLREERKRLELLTNDVVDITGTMHLPDNLLLEKLLQNTSFENFQFKKKDDSTDHETVKTILSNSSLFQKVVQQRSSIVATLRGSYEPDRWVVLSVSGDGISLALELVQIFSKLRAVHNWQPQRTIIFCFFDEPNDSCHDILSKYLKSRIVAYLAVHGDAIQKRGCLVASGSEIVRSVVLGTAKESISASKSDYGRVFESCKIGDDSQSQLFAPRIASDIPHASLSFKTSNATNTEVSNEREELPYRRILTKIIGFNVWKFSESSSLHWDPKDFERGVKSALKMIKSLQLSVVKEKITSTIEKLVNGVQIFSQRINDVKDPSSLTVRMMNDLLMDLDMALLCPDEEFRSKTDLALIPGLLTESEESVSLFLDSMSKCYEDAFAILQEG